MSKVDIFDLDENIKAFKDEANRDDLDFIVEEFKRGHFLHVLSRTKAFRENYETNKGLANTLSLIDATCHSQVGDNQQAAEIIMGMYYDADEPAIDDLILYGNLAFMCDYKLARRIMSDAVKRIESNEAFDRTQAGHAYLVLGEAEENLQKYKRAIKYYKQGLTYFQGEQEREMAAFLHFKLGALNAQINEIDEAIDYLHKTIELANDNNIEIKMNSLVSIARMYGSKDEYKQAITYLEKAIPMLEDSHLAHQQLHAEAYTEMAYNYFSQSLFDEATPYYREAIAIHQKVTNYSARNLGMIQMQYAYCLERKEQPNNHLAGVNYEKAYELLEITNDPELLENALADIMAFFDNTNNQKKKRFYEEKFVKLTNEKAAVH